MKITAIEDLKKAVDELEAARDVVGVVQALRENPADSYGVLKEALEIALNKYEEIVGE